jgi:MFS family permease
MARAGLTCSRAGVSDVHNKAGRISAGWIVVGSVTAVLMATSGARFLFGVVLKPVSEEFGWSRTDLSAAVLINMLVLCACQPLVGELVDRFGSRRMLLAGVLALVVTLIPISYASALWHWYLFYGVLSAFGIAATSPVNTTSLVSGWFTRRRGTAMAIATSGSAFGQLIIVPAAAFTLAHTDWHTVYRALALLLLIFVAPLVLLFVREAPEAMERKTRHQTKDGLPAPHATLRSSLTGSPFWLLAFGFFVCGFTMAFANTHFLAYADDMGMAPVDASHIVAATALFSIVGSVVLGLAADRYPRQGVLAVTYALRGLAFLLLLVLPAGGLTYLYAVILGISWTATTPLTAAIAADLYGRQRLGVIFGTMFTFMNLGFGAGAFLDGVAYDLTGSYHGALIVNVVFGFVAALAVTRVRPAPITGVHAELAAPGAPVIAMPGSGRAD